jgi:hypothetical protein
MMNMKTVQERLEQTKRHEPVHISKYNGLGKMFRVKKSTEVCLTCEEVWPCRSYKQNITYLVEDHHSLIKEHELLRTALDGLSATHMELLHRVALAKDALTNIAHSTEHED